MKQITVEILILMTGLGLGGLIYSYTFNDNIIIANNNFDPSKGYFSVDMPSYPGSRQFPLGSNMKTGNRDIEMNYFTTEDPVIDVARYYKNIWSQQGLYVYSQVTDEQAVVGCFDPSTKTIKSASIIKNNGKSWVFPAVISSTGIGNNILPWPQNLQYSIPVYPDSKQGLYFYSDDRNIQSKIVSYTNDAGVNKNLQYIKNFMKEKNWSLQKESNFKVLQNHTGLHYKKGRSRCTINLTGLTQNRVIVYIAWEEET